MSRSKNSLFNAVSALGMTLVNGLLGIVVTRFVIDSYGSDFNGLNSTANQIVNILLVLEGGFTVASNVALFGPLTRGEGEVVGGILHATRDKFRRIGLLFFLIGTAIAALYAGLANTALSWDFVFTLVWMTVFPAAFNLYYATTYRVLLQTQQKEYVINLFTIFTVALGHMANLVLVLKKGPMWMVRANTMVFTLINSLLIAYYVKKKNPALNLKAPSRGDLIRGTGDVMAQKITGVIYQSAPIVFLSISPTGGTVLASVYAVYSNVLIMLKNLLHGVIDAPRHSLGQLLSERKRDQVWGVFGQYEYVAFLAVFVLLTTCCVLILPFIQLYTAGITDANYYDLVIALLMVITAAVEMLHIPSGHLINMAGEFRVSRNFQVISCVVLVISMSLGGTFYGVYGMLSAILLCAVLLALMEMGYVHLTFFRGRLAALLQMLLPLVLVGVLACFLEMRLPVAIDSYGSFLFYGVLFALLNGALSVAVGLLFHRKVFFSLAKRALSLLKRS